MKTVKRSVAARAQGGGEDAHEKHGGKKNMENFLAVKITTYNVQTTPKNEQNQAD